MRKDSISLLPVYSLAFLNFTSMTLLYPVMPPYAASLGATVAQVGIVVAMASYMAALTQAPVGMLSGHLGRRTLLIAGTLLYTLSYFAFFFASNLIILMIIRAVSGLANAAFYPAASALVVDTAPPEKRGEALGWFTTATQLGSMAGPALGGFLLQNYAFRATFLASAVISLAGSFIAFAKSKDLGMSVSASSTDKLSAKWLWRKECLISLVVTILAMASIAAVVTFLPLYGPEIHINMTRVGLIIATVYIGSVRARAQAGKLSDKLGCMPVILAGMSLCATGTFLFSVLTGLIPLHGAAFIVGVGVGMVLPAGSALIANQAPLCMRGFAMGLNSSSFNTGMALGATGLGILADGVGFPKMYLATSVVVGISTLIMFLVTRQDGKMGTPQNIP